jgi:WD40 repeat protein/serine/threonine protein kinase
MQPNPVDETSESMPPPRAGAEGCAWDEGPGSRLGPYRLVQLIGEGGFGSVFLAEQESPVRREVALKVIKPGMDTRQVIARFQAERQALAMMDHPNIAQVFDAGATATGRPYFVMELVRGIRLNVYCDTNRLGLRKRLELFIPICRAIQHAHQKGIIHRDLKPSNILVEDVDGRPAPKVIDFGVVKATAGSLCDDPALTQEHRILGTPLYMSPEQARGGSGGANVDTRSDIYSLGAILYELLTGTTPIEADDLHACRCDEVQALIAEADPPRPSMRLAGLGDRLRGVVACRNTDARRLRRHVRGDLDCIVMKCLERDPERRYAAAINLARDVQRYLNHEEVQARPSSRLYRIRKFVRKNKVEVGATAAVVGALVGGLGAAGYGLRRASRALNAARQARVDESNQRKMAELRLVDGLISEANLLGLSGRWEEAKPLYADAHNVLQQLGRPTLVADVDLWDAYRNSPAALNSIDGSHGAIRAVAVGGDGHTALAGGDDGTLRLLDLRTGLAVRALPTRGERVRCAAFLGDGRTAIWAGDGGAIHLCDVESGAERRVLTGGHTGTITSLSISADGRFALSSGADKTLRWWDLSGNGGAPRVFATPTGFAGGAVLVSAEHPAALAAGLDGTLNLLDLSAVPSSGEPPRTLFSLPPGSANSVAVIAVAPAGDIATYCDGTETAHLLDLASGAVRPLVGHAGKVTAVAFSPDGRFVATGSQDRTMKLWDVAAGREVRTLGGQGSAAVTTLCFAPDGRAVLSGGQDGSLKLWDAGGGREVRTYAPSVAGAVAAFTVSPDGRMVLSARKGRPLTLWDLGSGHPLASFGESAGDQCIAFLPDGRRALVGGDDGGLKLRDLGSGRVIRTFAGHGGTVTCLALLPGGQTAISGSADHTLTLWDLASGQAIRTLTGHAAALLNISILPGGTALSFAADNTIRLWDLNDGRALRTLPASADAAASFALSPDGRILVLGNVDGNITLWDLASDQVAGTLSGHVRAVTSLAVSPDGRMIVSGGADGTLKLWDLVSRQEIRSLPGAGAAITGIRFAMDGHGGGGAVSCDANGTYTLWAFIRAYRYREFEPRRLSAQDALRAKPGDPMALAVLGEWYQFRGRCDWASGLLSQAAAGGANVSPALLARCYWQMGSAANAEADTSPTQPGSAAERSPLLVLAAEQFDKAIAAATDESERFHLQLCRSAVLGVHESSP